MSIRGIMESLGGAMKIFIIIFSLLSLLACKPEQTATEFNAMIKVPKANEAHFSTLEDTPVSISYSVDDIKSESSINLQVEIVKNPSNGKLSDCVFSNSNSQFDCTYTPNKNFHGTDTLEVNTKDGEMEGNKSSVVTIEVIPVTDAPITYDGSQYGNFLETIKVTLPKASDTDSLSSELTYYVHSVSSEGNLSGCNLTNGKRECNLNIDTGFKGQIDIVFYAVDPDGNVSNHSTLEVLSSSNSGVKVFTQGKDQIKKVDIVWVVDNSPSMAAEQKTLATNFESFVSNFLKDGKARFPFKMSVITTETYMASSDKTSFRTDASGNPHDLTSAKAETHFSKFKTDFMEAVQPGITGSGDERPLESMKRSLVIDPQWYGGDDTLLVYIILTDERESSFYPKEGHAFKSVDSWLEEFFVTKDKKHKIKVYPIIRMSNDHFNRHERMAELTGTFLSNIDKSFDNLLDEISSNITYSIDSFYIGDEGIAIKESSVKVYVEGSLQSSGWSLKSNNIVFDNPPPAGATIKVTFEYK